MRSRAVLPVFATLVAAGVYFVFAGPRRDARDSPGRADPVAAGTLERGRVVGAFDPRMSDVCRFACAASEPYQEDDLAVQPGVPAGTLTRCPVSGVVFVADPERPRAALATGEYVLCCDGCAKKFTNDPARFVRL